MTQGCQDASGDRLGKSVIFARNHRHAEFIRARFDHHYPHLAGKAARVIDNQIPYAQSLIDDFRAPRKIDVLPPAFGQKKAALEAAGEEKEIVISE